MKIYLYLTDKIVTFTLPKEIGGSFSFDYNPEEESKLINIEERDGKWVIYSTKDVNLVSGNSIVGSITIESDNFYLIRRNDKNYLIYISNIANNSIQTYSYDNSIDLIIGNSADSNIKYPCPFLDKMLIRIHYTNDRLVLENINKTTGIYINEKTLFEPNYFIEVGDQINIYGLKIMFLKDLLLMNNPGGKLVVLEMQSKIKNYLLPRIEENLNIQIKDKNLYEKEDYFSKSPRIRRFIKTKVIKLSPPPQKDSTQELPIILTVGPMLTMGMTSAIMVIDVINKINTHQTTFKESWTSLLTSGVMLTSMLLWPILTRIYNTKLKERKRKEIITKYNEYLETVKKELETEIKLQKDILIENLISIPECLKIVEQKNMNFWDKGIDQNDFLLVRIGTGNELLDVKIEYPEKEFTVEEDELKKQADQLVEKSKYIENVPISYSFYDNIITAIMGNKFKSINFTNNIILQLITFYSYEDLKLVVFTNEKNKNNWEYIKYLNHNFTNDKSFRFFSSTQESCKKLSDYITSQINNRIEEKKEINKPHYFIIIDDYERVKNNDFINLVLENENKLGFSIVIIEERLSKLPSKCNNFISLGSPKSGILQNTYESQTQTFFNDEITYNINMMEIAKKIANIPIEFEEEIKSLPESITFMEMERVGKVEQLNILNRWNTNDSTTSLKTEIGVDEQGDLMYLDLHEKYHGPHGLIAGTTGSGKSEFIITYILSMCINYSPDEVAFILIDYKGGGLALAFENKLKGISLPHLAGTITNLDKAEMDRTLVSIDSEIKRRQQMFNEARDKLGESTIDIYKYQRHYKEKRIDTPIPHLFIICDEFAELKAQQPEFMDNLISVARIGRSLGVHLILATQKPSGVVNDQIWSNTKFRVCLKVQDESDSKEMLKRPEAASIKQAGRYYLQVGYDEYFALGQSGWCGAKYYPSDKIIKQIDKSLNVIDDCGAYIKTLEDTTEVKQEAKGEEISAIMNSIIETASKLNKKSRKLWLDSIPSIILVEELEKKYNHINNKYNLDVVIGEYDAPEKQAQGLVKYNYLTNGNTAIYGIDGNEREKILNTLIYSTTKNHTSEEINYYIIDYGSESLKIYEKLPQVGGIVLADEVEKYNNLIKIISEEQQKRKKLFVNYGGDYLTYIKNNPNKLPIICIIINNFDSLYESYNDIYDTFPELIRDSERYGINFIITANATNSIPGKITQNIQNIYAFKLKDQNEYQYIFNSRNKVMLRNIEGRGLLNNDGVHEFQTASIIQEEDNLNEYLTEFISNQNKLNQPKAKRIPTLPNIVRVEDIQEKISNINSVPIGIAKNSLEIYTVNYLSSVGNIITSNKLSNTEKFIKSILNIFKILPNTFTMIIDPTQSLNLDINIYKNYYTTNLEETLTKINDYVEKLINDNNKIQGVILIYGLQKLSSDISDQSIIEKLFKNLKKYEKISLIAVEEAKKIKEIQYESWYTSLLNTSDGIWIGKGITDQSVLKTSNYSKELTIDYKNDMGYHVIDGEAILIRLIDFITIEETGENNEK